MRRLAVLLACAVSTCILGVQASPQSGDPQTVFRAAIDLVDVDVSVLDRNRLPVTGLTAADFTVIEDGKPRPIEAFTAVDLPPRRLASAPWMDRIAPDLITNSFPREGRLVVILMDRSLGLEHIAPAQRFAEAAVEQLRPGDLAAVIYTSRGVPQNFTADRARLLSAIRQPFTGLPDGDDGSPAECFCGACTLDAVADVAEAMEPVRERRKMLLVVGPRIAVQSSGACGGQLAQARQRAMRAVEAGNVTVHAFDPSGLPTLAVSASSSMAGTNRGVQAYLRRRGDLEVLPAHTGGRLVSDAVRPADRVAELFRESSSYYVLGFQPANPAADRRFRRIQVKVARKDVTLQARRGYYTDRRVSDRQNIPADITPGLRAAIESLWPRTDVPVEMTAMAIAKPDLRSATVAMLLRVSASAQDPSIRPASAESAAPGAVNVLVGAFDRNGRALAMQQQTLSVDARRSGGRAFEYEVLARLDLGPGRYEIRAAIEDSTAGQTGSVYGYVDVPDFQRDPVALSGLLIEAAPGRAIVPASGLNGVVPVVPTTRRDFDRTDRVTGFVRLYQGLGRAMMPGYVQAEILNDRNQSVFHQESRVIPEQYGASRAMDFAVDVPVARLEQGAYVLTIEARHGSQTARREARFTVR